MYEVLLTWHMHASQENTTTIVDAVQVEQLSRDVHKQQGVTISMASSNKG